MRLIDSDKLILDLMMFQRESENVHFLTDEEKDMACRGVDAALVLVNSAETIDAEPVRHGRWIKMTESPEWDQKRCSACGDISCCQRNYCPNCGAKMDGDVETMGEYFRC